MNNLNDIIYDIYGNLSDKDYKKIENVFINASNNKELYKNLSCYTKCYCNKIVRKNHINTHLLCKQHKMDAREILPNYMLFNYNAMNPNYLRKDKRNLKINNCKTLITFD